MNLLYSLPFDIQQVIWKIYFMNNVILEMKQQEKISFLMDSSYTIRSNDLIMIRYNTEWSQ
jgi:hypothetical protein